MVPRAFAAMLFFVARPAFAALVLPGERVSLAAVDLSPGTPRTSQTSTLSAILSPALPAWQFTLSAQVFQQPAGTLTFYYTITNNTTDPTAVDTFALAGTAGLALEAAFLAGAGTNAQPLYAHRSADGGTVTFSSFFPFLGPGTSTATFVLYTDALAYTPDMPLTLDVSRDQGGEAPSLGAVAHGTTLGPLAVPEPATGLLLSLSGSLLLTRRRKRERKAGRHPHSGCGKRIAFP